MNEAYGKKYFTTLGDFDSSKGAFRRLNVTAGTSTFPNYDKVISLTHQLIDSLNEKVADANSVVEQYELSFKAHKDSKFFLSL